MRPFRAALTVLTVLLMSLVVAGPASAGGPTSVLVVEPFTRTAASLYYPDADYQTLAGLVGANGESGVAGRVDRSGANHELGSGITLTWLVHDVAVWRVDRIYAEAKGGPWIATQLVMNDSGSVYDSPVVWHTATAGKALTTLLQRLGFGPDAKPAGADSGTGVAEGRVPASAAPERPAASQPADTGGQGTAGLAWGLAGLALGVALTVAAVRLLPTSRPATVRPMTPTPAADGPLDPSPPVQSEDERDWSIPDELSSTSR